MVFIQDGGLVPGLLLDGAEGEGLREDAERDLAEERREHFAGDEAGGGALARELWEGAGPAHEDGDGEDEQEVDEEELEVAEVGRGCVEEADGGELDGGVQAHVLEAAEAGDERGAAFFDDLRYAGDVEDAAGEWGCDRGFCFRERNAHVGGFQGTAVVGAVAAESDAVVDALEFFDQLVFLVGRHAGEDLTTHEHLAEDFLGRKVDDPAEDIATDS